MKKEKVVVIGGGPGGLASAMILAHRGFDVSLYEKQSSLGGRSAEISRGGYRFDLGPTFLMMKYLLDELFEEAGTSTEEHLDCVRLDPMYRLDFGGRKSLLVTSQREEMKKQIEAVFPGESGGLDRFYDRESQRFEKLYPCLQKAYGSVTDLLSVSLLKAFPHLAAGRSLYDVLSDYFQSEELRLSFTFQSKYLGMSPWDCPGLFAMIPYTEHAHGIYHVQGGLSEIGKAFAKIARARGARLQVDAPVTRVLVEKGRASGVLLESGETVLADHVIVNADFGHAVTHLFPPEAMRKWSPKKLEKLQFSCSTFMIYLGLDRIYPCEHHAIFFAKDYKKNLKDISEHFRLSEDFSVYVRNASITDPTLAPAGHSALYILVPVPNNRSGVDWSEQREEFRNRVIGFLEKNTPYQGLSDHIREEIVITPKDWEEKRSVHLGATFNLGHQMSQLLLLRPHNAFEEFKDCYLVGGGTHPGSGLPTIFESARIASNLICAKSGVPFEEPKPFDPRKAV